MPEETSSALEMPSKAGGVIITASVGSVIGDIVGRDRIGLDEEKLVSVLEARGIVQAAETAGLQRRVIITLATRLRPEERLDFDQAVTELERAVEIALDVIQRGQRGADEARDRAAPSLIKINREDPASPCQLARQS